MSDLLTNYIAARESGHARLKEPSGKASKSLEGELALQAAFYAGDFGLAWKSEDGEHVEAMHLGEWNREPGPDFVGAALRIDGIDVRGDIEIDREDLDWERHGHSTNPAFENVRLHVVFQVSQRKTFTRTTTHRLVPRVRLDSGQRSTSRGKQAGNPGDPGNLKDVLEAAARFRLSKKRERWLRAEALHGCRGALFQAAATALGYKNNKVPFLLVAQRVGLERASGPNGEALLFGIAGFLGAEKFDVAGADARSYARSLWDSWWTLRDRDSRLMLPPDSWNFSATRPTNHPHRRLGALAAIPKILPSLEKALKDHDSALFLKSLASLSHDFWNHHASLSGTRLKRASAIIGEERAVEMAANVLAPAAPLDRGLQILASLHCGNTSGKVKRAMSWLGVPETDFIKLASTALGQQALLQIYEDFFPTDPRDFLPMIRDGV